MGSAPRSWQKSLSNLSVTSKVGIVLLLPVVLASAFAVLRIKDELGTISQLSTASEQAQIIRPTLDFGSAANSLAVTVGHGDAAPQSALDQASARFDQAAADLQTALQNSETAERVSTELTEALAAGRTLRNSVQGGAPQEVVQQTGELNTHISNAVSSLATPKETSIERLYVQMGVIAIARQMFTQQQLALQSGQIADNPAVLSQVLIASGAELTMINQYAVVQPDSALKPDVLQGALQTRIAALSQNAVEPIDVPGVAQSLQTSTATYDEAADHLVDLIESGLADRSISARSTVLRDVALVVTTLVAGLALALGVARSLVVPIRRLRRDSLQVAHTDLPAELAIVRSGGATPDIAPVDVKTTEEIGQLARAVDDMHHQALYLAAEQARLRLQISSMFETLSRRSQSLVEQQLSLIEDLERDEDNPTRLQSLFRLDHLATRMRRNGDNLLVLAGTALRRGHLPPVPLSDMLWSAVSQVEDYQRVEIGSVPDGIVSGEPAVDIEHLLAELIDNSLRYSPPNTPVAVSVSRAVDGGYLIEITDRGLGMSTEDMDATNDRLASGGEVTIEAARRMGLFVVGRLAGRHTITVSLRRTSSMAQQPGITASVHMPGALVSHTDSAAPPPPLSAAAPPISSTFPPPISDFPAPVTDFPASVRTLTAVPNPPEPFADTFGDTTDAPESGPPTPPGQFTSGGLPQRRSAEQPDSEPAVPVTRLTPLPDHRDAGVIGDTGDTGDASDAVTGTWATNGWLGGNHTTEENAAGQRPPETDPSLPTGPWFQAPEQPQQTPPQPDQDAGSEFPPRPPLTVPAGAQPPSQPIDIWAETAIMTPVHRSPDREPALPGSGTTLAPSRAEADAPVQPGHPSPIYQRMVSEWLVEPSANEPDGGAVSTQSWASPADDGWAAAADASAPTADSRTSGGLPIRRPGAQLVPGGLTPDNPAEVRDPEEIRNNLSRHLSGVRSGRVNAQHNPAQHAATQNNTAQRHNAQQNDGGLS